LTELPLISYLFELIKIYNPLCEGLGLKPNPSIRNELIVLSGIRPMAYFTQFVKYPNC
jgi:hypothetical protein